MFQRRQETFPCEANLLGDNAENLIEILMLLGVSLATGRACHPLPLIFAIICTLFWYSGRLRKEIVSLYGCLVLQFTWTLNNQHLSVLPQGYGAINHFDGAHQCLIVHGETSFVFFDRKPFGH